MNYYDDHAESLAVRYRALDPKVVHAAWADTVLGARQSGIACDVGAGSGRDADWLAARGWDVVAVEPSAALRRLGEAASDPRITWLADRLPALSALRDLDQRFDLVLVSAVWMHVPPGQRERAFRTLTHLLRPGGHLVITLRHGRDEAENERRCFHEVSAGELLALAKRRAVVPVLEDRRRDPVRDDLEWETLVFRVPDDGTGGLPLLRHIIVNDNKTASYKLALLRALTRLAEGAPGIACGRSEDWVEIPLGAVALYWIRIYRKLLLQYRLHQHGVRGKGYGFAKAAFNELQALSPWDLRIGGSFSHPVSVDVTRALRDACESITKNPAHFTTWPGSNQQVFQFERRAVRDPGGAILLSPEYLRSFGIFRIPAFLWQTFAQYACWLEPSILEEWRSLQVGWNIGEPLAASLDVFAWDEARRDTRTAFDCYEQLSRIGKAVPCTWTGAVIRTVNIDHCFPWARWLNNDLWNLLPARRSVNSEKGDRLPSAGTVAAARERMLHWWAEAYDSGVLRERFRIEASTSLPLVAYEASLDEVFNGLRLQRNRLKADQQLAEWTLKGL